MGIFERYLSVWVGLCILLGVVLGTAVSSIFAALAAVVGMLVKVLVRISLAAIVNRTRWWPDPASRGWPRPDTIG